MANPPSQDAGMMRYRTVALTALLLQASRASSLEAQQETRPVRGTGSVLVGIQGPDYPGWNAPPLVGVGIGVEHRLTVHLAARLSATLAASVPEVFAGQPGCVVPPGQPAPPGPCGGSYAALYVPFALDVLAMPVRGVPLFLLGGVGWSALVEGSTSRHALLPDGRGIARVGAGAMVGRGSSAPRIEVTLTRLLGNAGTANRLLLLQLWRR